MLLINAEGAGRGVFYLAHLQSMKDFGSLYRRELGRVAFECCRLKSWVLCEHVANEEAVR